MSGLQDIQHRVNQYLSRQSNIPFNAYAPIAEQYHRHCRLLTNNPDKSKALIAHGIQISATLPLETVSNTANHAYLSTKRHRMGHRLNLLETA